MKTNFDLPKNTHQCTSFRLGDKIIWKCPLCPDYERSLDLDTGTMTVKGQTDATHTGSNDGSQDMSGLTLNLNEQ